MKRIAIVAPYKEYNYGTVLQAYALQHLVESEGVEAAYLQYTALEPPPIWRKVLSVFISFCRRIIPKKTVVTNNGLDDYSFFYLQEFKPIVAGFDAFINNRIKVSKHRYTPSTLPQCREFDAFMVGSDQTWGEARCQSYSPFFLEGIDEKYPKLSYAPSIGTTHISDAYLSVLEEKLAKFQALSCREKTNCGLLSQKLGRKVSFVLDPTLMLSVDDWSHVCTMPFKQLRYREYILCYILGEKHSISEFAERLGAEKGLPVYYIVTRPLYMQKTLHLFVTPESFLGLIKSAAYVITDSFHGTVLSINFNTQFYSFTKREGLSSVDNDRIIEVLNSFYISNRFKDGNKEFEIDIDYANVNSVVERYRIESRTYLQSVIKTYLR